jgi:hypothetical protein
MTPATQTSTKVEREAPAMRSARIHAENRERIFRERVALAAKLGFEPEYRASINPLSDPLLERLRGARRSVARDQWVAA